MKKKVLSVFFALVLVLSLSLVTAAPAAAATITVDDSGGADHLTIQAAINVAGTGDTIVVSAGTYDENVSIGVEGLTLQSSDGAATTTIDGSDSGTVVNITADNVTVSGFTITGTAADVNVFTDCGVTLTAVSGCTIEDNTVNYDGGIGIKLQEADGNTIRGNSIEGSSIAGIALFGSSNNTVDSNVSNGTFETIFDGNHMGYGIWLDYYPPEGDAPTWPGPGYSVGNTINNNTFSNNQIDGVYFGQYSDGNTLTNNIIQDNGMLGGADGNGIYFWNNRDLSPNGNTVTSNTITGNVASGMELYKSPRNTITQNTITGNNTGHKDPGGGILIRATGGNPSPGNVVNNNNIFGNNGWGIFVHADAAIVDATNNWWGSADGPSEEGGGSGDAVSTNVDFTPWQTEEVGVTTVALTADVPDIVAISVDPTSIDFGTVYPGQTAVGDNITVANIGTHKVNVNALIPVGTVLQYLELATTGSGWLPRTNWIDIVTDLAMGTYATIETQLPVPAGYTPGGSETATLIFIATPTT